MFALKNYTKFVVGGPVWEDFYIHRFPSDLKKLVTFQTRDDAQAFLDTNPSLEKNFDAWIVEINPAEWSYKGPFGH